jgi:hypothetical protein
MIGYLIHGASNVLGRESLERVDAWARINANIFQGGLKGCEILAFQQGVDSQRAVGGTVDAVLRPHALQIPDQFNPLLRGSFFQDMHKLLVGCQAGRLAGTGFQLEVDELWLVLVFCREDFWEQGQHRLER